MKRIVSGILLMLLLMAMFSLSSNIKSVKSEWTGTTVYIMADGSIYPPYAPIVTSDKITYTLTDNITSSAHVGIVIERDDIVLDGAGYTIQGTLLDSWQGINLTSRYNITIKNINIMYFNTGIFIGNSSHISVIGNNVTTNLYNGIVLYRSSYISITGSNIMENRYGIHLMDSSHNSIIGNNITFNIELGIYIEDSSFNSIYHNNFVNNTKHVYSTGSTNVWDDGYPSGGNYWSNYTDVDFYNGPNQDQPGSDGIWDHSYLIRDDNSDRYPFVNIIPEFPSTTILTIFMLMTTTLAVLARHRRLKHRR